MDLILKQGLSNIRIAGTIPLSLEPEIGPKVVKGLNSSIVATFNPTRSELNVSLKVTSPEG